MIVQCTSCGEYLEVPVTEEQIKEWRGGTLIQKAMPNIPPAQRELFISGTCGKCWDELFKDGGEK